MTVRLALSLASLALLAVAQPAAADGAADEGRAVFMKNGCHGCHTIGKIGTPLGPDLSRVGFKYRAEYIERWLRDPFPLDATISIEAAAVTDELELCLEARGELDPALYQGLLRARRTVLLKGVGRRLAGTWYVASVRTVLDGGALTQTFVLQRNAVAPSGSERFGTTTEEADA